MKTYFIVADVHSFYDEMIKALNGAGFDVNNPMHIFVSLGDLLDRGPKPLQCLRFVNSLPEDRKILIRGNHEDLMEEMIARRESKQHDWHNGTIQTALDLAEYGLTSFVEFDVFDVMRKHPDYNEYINSTVDYYEDDKHIFVHGWIPCKSNDLNMYHARGIKYTFDENWRDGDWERARWINGAFDNAPWSWWFDEIYCQNCPDIMCKYGSSNREFSCSYCELNDKCKFFPEYGEAPSNKEIIKMWLESESEDN